MSTEISVYSANDPLCWVNSLGVPTNIEHVELELTRDGVAVPTDNAHVRLSASSFSLTVVATGLPAGDYVAVSTGQTYDARLLTDERTFTVSAAPELPSTGDLIVYPASNPIFWANIFGVRTQLTNISGEISHGGQLFPENPAYFRELSDGRSYEASVLSQGLAPGDYTLTSTGTTSTGRVLTDRRIFNVSGTTPDPENPNGTYPLFSVADLAAFSGRPGVSYPAYAAQALQQAVLLFKLATCRKTWLTDPDEVMLAKNAILSVADGMVLGQRHQAAAASPFSSETIGSYSYSKLQKQVRDSLPTGDNWFDMAVEQLSICEIDSVVSGATAVFDTTPPSLYAGQRGGGMRF